jgi:hypothetical protein
MAAPAVATFDPAVARDESDGKRQAGSDRDNAHRGKSQLAAARAGTLGGALSPLAYRRRGGADRAEAR